jgi:hypothetical protein
MRWCTVTVTDQDGRRHSVDVQATSTFDAAHLFVVEAKKERAVGLPKPTLATVFEVVAAGKVYRVTGTAPQTWIVEKRRGATAVICEGVPSDRQRRWLDLTPKPGSQIRCSCFGQTDCPRARPGNMKFA